MPVVIQGGLGLLGTSAPEVGSWVKLRNIGVRVVASQLQVGGQAGGAGCAAAASVMDA